MRFTNHVGDVKTWWWPHLGLKTRLFKRSHDSSFWLTHHRSTVDAFNTHKETSVSTLLQYVLLLVLVTLRLDRALQFVSEGLRCNLWTKNHELALYNLSLFHFKLFAIQVSLKNPEHLHCSWPLQASHRVLMWSLRIALGLPAYLHGSIVLLKALYGNKWEMCIALHRASLKFQLTLRLHASRRRMILSFIPCHLSSRTSGISSFLCWFFLPRQSFWWSKQCR